MIAASSLTRQPDGSARSDSWQWQLAQAVTDPAELLRLLDLDPRRHADTGRALAAGHAGFPLRVPRGFIGRMRRGDPSDPLLLQVLPTARELIEQHGFVADPLAEHAATQAPGCRRRHDRGTHSLGRRSAVARQRPAHAIDRCAAQGAAPAPPAPAYAHSRGAARARRRRAACALPA